MSCMLLVLHTDAATDSNFNDTRCKYGGVVCPTDPLLFTCMVTDSPATRATIAFSFAEMELIGLTNNNVTQGIVPEGIHIQSYSVTGDGPYDYTLILVIANASLLNGGWLACGSNVGDVDRDGCPVAGELSVGSFVAVHVLFSLNIAQFHIITPVIVRQ